MALISDPWLLLYQPLAFDSIPLVSGLVFHPSGIGFLPPQVLRLFKCIHICQLHLYQPLAHRQSHKLDQALVFQRIRLQSQLLIHTNVMYRSAQRRALDLPHLKEDRDSSKPFKFFLPDLLLPLYIIVLFSFFDGYVFAAFPALAYVNYAFWYIHHV